MNLVQLCFDFYMLEAAKPENMVGDRAYDSDKLDGELREEGVEMIALHRKNRKRKKTQDGRRLCRYKRRWLVECFFWMASVESSVDSLLGGSRNRLQVPMMVSLTHQIQRVMEGSRNLGRILRSPLLGILRREFSWIPTPRLHRHPAEMNLG